ncbi:MAG: hypothetical protein KGS72_23660 [Cyanobacteria bacterium REEB67]|nr:hypothetical protein [Cyanobacteria bacterium REEB67]
MNQPWLSSAKWDTTWIIAPAFISTIAVLIFRKQMLEVQNVPLWVWVCFILLIDVAHVYATLFRTYLDRQAFARNKTILLAAPLVAWAGGSLLYCLDEIFFWRALAYLAVFHFIRQQFGFMVLYSRRENTQAKRFRFLDGAAIYAATIYPVLFWHTHLRNFCWFVPGDFFQSAPSALCDIGFSLYAIIACAYAAKEIYLTIKSRTFNLPKNLLLLATALSWWVGIISVNSDMAFTITNVVSHGVPYMALVWLYHGHKKAMPGESGAKADESESTTKSAAPKIWQAALLSNVLVFFLFLAFLAYIEEGFWDGLIWREHLNVFAPFAGLPLIGDAALLGLLVPFLSLPQSTHYLLDGFIWRVKERNNIWSA